MPFVFPLRRTLYVYWVISYAAFSSGPFPADSPYHCSKVLAVATSSGTLGHLTQQLLLDSYGDGGNAQLELLATYLDNPLVKSPHTPDDLHIEDTLRRILFRGSSQDFYKGALKLVLDKKPFGYLKLAEELKMQILPDTLPGPKDFPAAAFAKDPVLDQSLSHTLGALFDYNPKIRSEHFTRRLFAYVSRYPELTQEEKFNLAVNCMREFQREKEEYNRYLPLDSTKKARDYSFYPKENVASDGTIFICGVKRCNYFFAISKDGRFYIGETTDLSFLNFERWREPPSSLREAQVLTK